MKRASAGLLLLALMTPLRADGVTPQTPTRATSALQVTPKERQFFEFGYQIGKAAFAYAELGKRATQIARTGNKLTQLQQLAGLASLAAQDRTAARDGFGRALALMEALQAPPSVLAPVRLAAARLSKSLSPTGDAKRISIFSRRAAQTLASLDEFNDLSSLPDAAAIQHWLTSAPPGQVWYAEGLITALGETAAAFQMPDLLPPVKEIATDLRGLRDWLSLRLPDDPTPDQTALVTALDNFLLQTSRTGRPQLTLLAPPQLQSLGDISRRLQMQILGDTAGSSRPGAELDAHPGFLG